MNPLEAATKQYVDNSIAAIDIPEPPLDEYLELKGGTMTGPLILSANPSQPLGAVTKQYADSLVVGLGSGDFKRDGSLPMTGELQMGGFKIRDLAAPGLASDAVTKSYVDGEVDALQGQIDNLGNAF